MAIAMISNRQIVAEHAISDTVLRHAGPHLTAVTLTWAVGQTVHCRGTPDGRIPPFSWDPDATMSVMHSHGVGITDRYEAILPRHP